MVIPTPVSLLYTCTEAIKTMNLNLRWPASHSASCFHTIHAWLRWRRLADGRLADAIAPAAEELARQVAATEVSAEQFWSHLIALSAGIDGNRELAETAVRKTLHSGVVPDAPIAALVGSISDAEAAFHAATPNLLDQLGLR